eukprot:scaffold20056_cov33-Tisochrysis_lutea.AAC.3
MSSTPSQLTPQKVVNLVPTPEQATSVIRHPDKKKPRPSYHTGDDSEYHYSIAHSRGLRV